MTEGNAGGEGGGWTRLKGASEVKNWLVVGTL